MHSHSSQRIMETVPQGGPVFEFSTPGRVIFGEGAVAQLPEVLAPFGRRLLIVTGSHRKRFLGVVGSVTQRDYDIASVQVRQEPTLLDLEEGLAAARKHKADCILGIGGGSALDIAKAVAAVTPNPAPLTNYLEVVGRGSPLPHPGLPCIAVPTTAGTGCEVTRNAVIDIPSHRVKVSLRGEQLLPRVALVDPSLTLTVPPEVTAATGFDALVQVFEPFVSNRSNPMTDALAKAGISLAAKALRRVYQAGNDIAARTDMALVSLWGGMCLANARLGAVHGLAGVLGGMFHAPHGAVCAALLGPVWQINVAALMRRGGQEETTLKRYAEIARLLTGDGKAKIVDGIDWVKELALDLGIQGLREFGVTRKQFDEITERGLNASSMQGNPVRLEPSEVKEILARAL